MKEEHLYKQIAESIRQEILHDNLKPGERLPSVREMCARWSCTPGTVQRAYQELVQSGLLISRAGQGTQVAGHPDGDRSRDAGTLRRANLVHRAEGFLLEVLTNGFSLTEVQDAFAAAMDRWRAIQQDNLTPVREVIRFIGSHDPLISGLTSRISEILPGVALDLSFAGSLGGLKALADGKADVAGCHLWDDASDEYNLPFIRRLLADQPVEVITLAHRNLGLIVYPGNPHQLSSLQDLTKPGVRFVNRQPGSGTRVWLDHQLEKRQIRSEQINGYSREYLTHSDVARQVAEGLADAALGLESAALAYGLDFVFLTRERYDLVFQMKGREQDTLRQLADWITSEAFRTYVTDHRGYDARESGKRWSIE